MKLALRRGGWGLAVFAIGAALAAEAAASPKPGDRTVAQVCAVCHGAGLMGAPKIGDGNAWQGRLQTAGSIDALAASAERGKGNMPPRGGQYGLTEDDLKAAIQYMLDKSGVSS
jgi:cytochrome c5